MKTTYIKRGLILFGSTLMAAETMRAGITDQFSNSVNNELSNFHIQGFFVIVGVIAAGLGFYFLNNKLNKEEKALPQKKTVAAHQRRMHHRGVIKKTA